MPGHWMCVVILNAFENAFGSKWAMVLNMAQLYMQGLRRNPNMSDYGSMHLNNA